MNRVFLITDQHRWHRRTRSDFSPLPPLRTSLSPSVSLAGLFVFLSVSLAWPYPSTSRLTAIRHWPRGALSFSLASRPARPQLLPAVSWQWVSTTRHRYLQLKLHTLCFLARPVDVGPLSSALSRGSGGFNYVTDMNRKQADSIDQDD